MSDNVIAGYLTEQQMAEQRGKGARSLRLERQRKVGPPFVRDGRKCLYPIDGFRDWLRANEQLPIRTETPGPAPGPGADRSPALKPRATPAAKPQPPAPRAAPQATTPKAFPAPAARRRSPETAGV
jgi:hypothetical protein